MLLDEFVRPDPARILYVSPSHDRSIERVSLLTMRSFFNSAGTTTVAFRALSQDRRRMQRWISLRCAPV